MILGRRSNPPMSFLEAGILQRVTRDSSDDLFESSGNGDDDGRALEFRSEGKISEIVLTQVNTNEGEGLSFLFLGSTIALIIVALVIIAIIVCELRRPATSADGRRDSRTDDVIIA